MKTYLLTGIATVRAVISALAVKGLSAPVNDGDAVNYATFKTLMARVAALEARL